MNRKYLFSASLVWVLLFVLAVPLISSAQNSFKVVPLGIRGGADESNLSSYMVAPLNSESFICLDAGTVYSGIRKARQNGVFHKGIDEVLKHNIKAYLISHGHLDHVAGLILNSPDDTTKNIYGLPSVISVLKDHYFTWKSWANFGDAGDPPFLNKYHYVNLKPSEEIEIANTEMEVSAYPLSHGPHYESTAFLVRHQDNYLLYLGDTGPDEIEKSDDLKNLWKRIAPLIQTKKLRAIFIEVSFPNSQPDDKLFGHLTPAWLMKELDVLASLTGVQALRYLPIVITHTKPLPGNIEKIKEELRLSNKYKLNLQFPTQGKMMRF